MDILNSTTPHFSPLHGPNPPNISLTLPLPLQATPMRADGRYINPPSADELRLGVLTSYLFIFIVGAAGNCLVIYVVAANREVRVKSVANYYICNLAVADLMFLLTLPFTCYNTYVKDWPFGAVSCKMLYAVRECNKYVSVFTLVVLSIDRYIASFYNCSRYRTIGIGKVTISLIWILFLIITTPYWLYAQTVTITKNSPGPVILPQASSAMMLSSGTISSLPSLLISTLSPQAASEDISKVGLNQNLEQGSSTHVACRIFWPSASRLAHVKSWTYSQLVFGFVAPFLAIFLAYLALGVRLHRLLVSSSVRAAVKRPGVAMTRTALVISLTFLLTQLPYHVLEVMNVAKTEALYSKNEVARWAGARYSNSTRGSLDTSGLTNTSPAPPHEIKAYVIFAAVVKILVFMSSCANPVIYGLLNRNYRDLYRNTVCRVFCRSTDHQQNITFAHHVDSCCSDAGPAVTTAGETLDNTAGQRKQLLAVAGPGWRNGKKKPFFPAQISRTHATFVNSERDEVELAHLNSTSVKRSDDEADDGKQSATETSGEDKVLVV